MTVISLLTDFGNKNGFSGMMKGVIWSIAPSVQIADISHEISPQNILEGAITLWRAASFFPVDSIHVAVVDPGVGTDRRALAARIGNHFYVGPDNGIFSPLLDQAEKMKLSIQLVNLTKPRYWLPSVSVTFHGRDVFSPVAAHLANGVRLEEFGEFIDDPVRMTIKEPEKTESGWMGQVILIDAFGNIATNLRADLIHDHNKCLIKVSGHVIRGLVSSYGAGSPGDVVALIDSRNYIEVAVVNGSGEQVLDVTVGDLVELQMLD